MATNELCIYARPPHTQITVLLDNGVNLLLPATIANGRDDAHVVVLPAGTTAQGAVVRATLDGIIVRELRGIVCPADLGPADFRFDDFGDVTPPATPEPDPPLPPNPYADPEAILHRVYAEQYYDLSTKEGCGTFTEAVVEALHAEQSDHWGHIRKTAAQNQWNGHAVDAVLLLVAVGETAQGCYDIIWSTESPDAVPLWTYKGPDPNAATIWYYGPMPCPPL